MNKTTPITVTVKGDSITKTHPSFAMVRFSRVTSSPPGIKLFGSELPSQAFINLKVVEAEKVWNLSQEWYHGGKVLLDLNLSASQFAELLTSMNVGSGVPATLSYVHGKGNIPDFIDEQTLPEQIKEDIKADAKSVIDEVKAFRADVTKLLGESKITRKAADALLERANRMEMTVSSNMPFVIDQYVEAVDKVTATGKAEVESFMMHAVTKMGLKSLNQAVKLLELEDKK